MQHGSYLQGRDSRPGRGKFAPPSNPIQVERTLETMEPTQAHVNERMMQYWGRVNASDEPGDIKLATALQLGKTRWQLQKEQIRNEFVDGFDAWLAGRSKYNTRQHHTSWGRKSLFHLPSVVAYFDKQVDAHFKFKKCLLDLYRRGPRDLYESWLYYKYIVRAQEWVVAHDSVPPWFDLDGKTDFLDKYAMNGEEIADNFDVDLPQAQVRQVPETAEAANTEPSNQYITIEKRLSQLEELATEKAKNIPDPVLRAAVNSLFAVPASATSIATTATPATTTTTTTTSSNTSTQTDPPAQPPSAVTAFSTATQDSTAAKPQSTFKTILNQVSTFVGYDQPDQPDQPIRKATPLNKAPTKEGLNLRYAQVPSAATVPEPNTQTAVPASTATTTAAVPDAANLTVAPLATATAASQTDARYAYMNQVYRQLAKKIDLTADPGTKSVLIELLYDVNAVRLATAPKKDTDHYAATAARVANSDNPTYQLWLDTYEHSKAVYNKHGLANKSPEQLDQIIAGLAPQLDAYVHITNTPTTEIEIALRELADRNASQQQKTTARKTLARAVATYIQQRNSSNQLPIATVVQQTQYDVRQLHDDGVHAQSILADAKQQKADTDQQTAMLTQLLQDAKDQRIQAIDNGDDEQADQAITTVANVSVALDNNKQDAAAAEDAYIQAKNYLDGYISRVETYIQEMQATLQQLGQEDIEELKKALDNRLTGLEEVQRDIQLYIDDDKTPPDRLARLHATAAAIASAIAREEEAAQEMVFTRELENGVVASTVADQLNQLLASSSAVTASDNTAITTTTITTPTEPAVDTDTDDTTTTTTSADSATDAAVDQPVQTALVDTELKLIVEPTAQQVASDMDVTDKYDRLFSAVYRNHKAATLKFRITETGKAIRDVEQQLDVLTNDAPIKDRLVALANFANVYSIYLEMEPSIPPDSDLRTKVAAFRRRVQENGLLQDGEMARYYNIIMDTINATQVPTDQLGAPVIDVQDPNALRYIPASAFRIGVQLPSLAMIRSVHIRGIREVAREVMSTKALPSADIRSAMDLVQDVLKSPTKYDTPDKRAEALSAIETVATYAKAGRSVQAVVNQVRHANNELANMALKVNKYIGHIQAILQLQRELEATPATDPNRRLAIINELKAKRKKLRDLHKDRYEGIKPIDLRAAGIQFTGTGIGVVRNKNTGVVVDM
jgi:hypothetical protein